MRPGISTSLLEGAVGIGATIDVYRAGRCIAVDVPVLDVVVEYQSSRVVPGQVTLRVPKDLTPTEPWHPMNNKGQRSNLRAVLEAGGARYQVDLGWFLHTKWVPSDAYVEVTMLDLMQVLEENPMTWPWSPTGGMTLRDCFVRVCNAEMEGTGLGVVFETGAPNPVVPPATQFAYSRTDAIREMRDRYGVDCAVWPDGQLHVWARKRASAADVHYQNGLLLDVAGVSGVRTPNRFTVVYEEAENTATRFAATAQDFRGEFSPRVYGLVNERRAFNIAANQAAVKTAADTYLRNSRGQMQLRSLEIVADPRLELGDVVAVADVDGQPLIGRVSAYSLSLSDPGRRMRVDVEVLQW